MDTCVRAYMYVHTYVYVSVDVNVHTHTHTHTHIDTALNTHLPPPPPHPPPPPTHTAYLVAKTRPHQAAQGAHCASAARTRRNPPPHPSRPRYLEIQKPSRHAPPARCFNVFFFKDSLVSARDILYVNAIKRFCLLGTNLVCVCVCVCARVCVCKVNRVCFVSWESAGTCAWRITAHCSYDSQVYAIEREFFFCR